jgi:hypothetical protein
MAVSITSENSRFALTPRPPSAVETARAGAKRIQSAIVADTLALAKKQQSTPAAAKFRIGQYEWCEPDYRQILIWAEALKLEPEEVIQGLLKGKTHVEKGRLLKIGWDFELLPLKDFQWGDGLRTTHLVSWSHSCAGPWRLGVKLPELTHLAWVNAFLFELDLSGCPRLQWLDCSFNAISHLDLTSVPNLAALHCQANAIEELDLSPVPRLVTLDWSANACGRKLKALKRLTRPGLPDLTSLWCSSDQLSSLDLSGLPNLTHLECSNNEIRELDLSKVPLLEELCCYSNPMSFLDIRPLHRLNRCHWQALLADSCETHLIQRPDQHF